MVIPNPEPIDQVVYINTEYGFNIVLPLDWKGYSIIASRWQGTSVNDATAKKYEGPEISIRHPLWTKESPRQDIPIMVFTPSEWDLIQQEKLSLGAAPIGPSELDRNAKYIFALPARYNFAYPTGFEEVIKIIEGKPLNAF